MPNFAVRICLSKAEILNLRNLARPNSDCLICGGNGKFWQESAYYCRAVNKFNSRNSFGAMRRCILLKGTYFHIILAADYLYRHLEQKAGRRIDFRLKFREVGASLSEADPLRFLQTQSFMLGLRSLQGPVTGYIAAGLVVVVWSFWLVISRVGATSSLTIYDLAAMRYGVSGLISLPLVLWFKPWRDMGWYRVGVLSFILSPVYILMVFAGFLFAPVAHAGVFMNGFLPLFSILLGFVLFQTKPLRLQLYGACLIFLAAITLTFNETGFSLSQNWKGDLFFTAGGAFFACYVLLSRHWQINTLQVLLCGAVINALIYVPVWFLVLPSGLAQTETDVLMLQVFYQGLVPNLFGLIMIAHASRTIGAEVTSAWMAFVPAGAAFLGVHILNETLPMSSWVALVLLTFGLCLVSVAGKSFGRSKTGHHNVR